MTTWPPTLDELRADLQVPDGVTDDDPALQACLDAAVTFVERVRSDVDFAPHPLGKAPGADLALGTLRLAGRWFTRRRSPDALISMGDLGSARVPSFDPDIDQLLRVGRFARAVVA
ncbi:hypothetical protein DMP23_00235 [Amycolatopsis sp. A1MSW2902]|uniref:hypothetical protein n=1 Tax=Amycolatopsis sp. A1MSW2902 TaxID=687413 RepID=UPI00307D3808